MTLTTILPTLRQSLPDPLQRSAWPEYTHATTTDVVVAGVSMVRLTELCQTPCVHTADALVPGSHMRASLRRDATVVVVGVTDVFQSPSGRIVLIDGDLAGVAAIWGETRLIGRVSTAASTAAVLLAGAAGAALGGRGETLLPTDVAPGDLLAVPCRGLVVLHDVRPRAAAEPTPDAGDDDDDPNVDFPGSCGR